MFSFLLNVFGVKSLSLSSACSPSQRSCSLAATSAQGVMQAIEKIYPIVQEFRCALRMRGEVRVPRKRAAAGPLDADEPHHAPVRRLRPRLPAGDENPHGEEYFDACIQFEDEEEVYEAMYC